MNRSLHACLRFTCHHQSWRPRSTPSSSPCSSPTKTRRTLTTWQQQQNPKSKQDPLAFKPGLDVKPRQLKLYSRSQIPAILNAYLENSRHVDPLPYMAAATVLPMRANNYVIEELIDWSNIPDDPIFQLVFPQPGMLEPGVLSHVQNLLLSNVDRVTLRSEVEKVREGLNPHPAGQKELNVPKEDGESLPGLQHKYRETVLFFPSEGQYCHSYCTYCFRWAQFTSVGSDQTFQSDDPELLQDYLRSNTQISDVLFTGGDPMVMTSRQLRRYLAPIAHDSDFDHIATIRIGSKSLAYWPYKFVTDPDADEMLRLFEMVVQSGRHLAFMAHFSHPRELSTPIVQEAIRRIQMTGVKIRSQAPLINHVNADARTWATMWRAQVRLGIIPYYMFVERDTGAKHYFEVPLAEAVDIYHKAISAVSGICRTVRGPSMSATPGKVHVIGITEIKGEKVFVLKFLQSRNPAWVEQPFFAKFDPKASWLNDLRPAFGEDKFFFEDELSQLEEAPTSSGKLFPYTSDMTYQNLVL